jgi:predicted amino acid racemase
MEDQKLKWKDFLLVIKKRYYPDTKIKDVGIIFREKLNVTHEDIKEDRSYFSIDDYLRVGNFVNTTLCS